MRVFAATVGSVVAVFMWAGFAAAADRWELGSNPSLSDDDNSATTRNELRPGDVQAGHDLQGTPVIPDRDWYIVRTQPYHTYEALVRSETLFWGSGTAFCVPAGGTSVCPRFDAVLADETVMSPGVPDGAANNANMVSALRVFMYGTGATSFLRVKGDTGGSTLTSADLYDITLRDTTYAIPRFNNTGTQTTVVVVQNTTDRMVHADVQLFDPDGALLFITGANLAPRGVWVLPTSTLAAVQGKAGSILVRQDGPYGALSGKAISLEPSTGFTFDTAMTPMSN